MQVMFCFATKCDRHATYTSSVIVQSGFEPIDMPNAPMPMSPLTYGHCIEVEGQALEVQPTQRLLAENY